MNSTDLFCNRSIELLEKWRKYPEMFATDYEAWINIVSTIILFAIPYPSFNNIEFYAKHLGTYGNTYLNLDKKLDNDWALVVADDALDILKRWKLKAFS